MKCWSEVGAFIVGNFSQTIAVRLIGDVTAVQHSPRGTSPDSTRIQPGKVA
jgi:hypothetical protein